MKGEDMLFGFVLTLAVVCAVGWLFADNEKDALQREAITHGYASYCPNNGEWAWKGECDD